MTDNVHHASASIPWAGTVGELSKSEPVCELIANTPSTSKPYDKSNPVDDFFARYPEFDYKPTASVSDEFRRMCEYFGWPKREDKRWAQENPGIIEDERKEGEQKKTGCRTPSKREAKARMMEARETFQVALIEQFNRYYGEDAEDFSNWRRLCQVLGLKAPGTMKSCRKLVKSTHVNLIDLIDAFGNGKQVTLHKSEKDLREYTRQTERYFPRERIGRDGVLRYLRRRIVAPLPDPKRKHGRVHKEKVADDLEA